MSKYTAGERLRLGEMVVIREDKVYRARSLKGDEQVGGMARNDLEEGDEVSVDLETGHITRVDVSRR